MFGEGRAGGLLGPALKGLTAQGGRNLRKPRPAFLAWPVRPLSPLLANWASPNPASRT